MKKRCCILVLTVACFGATYKMTKIHPRQTAKPMCPRHIRFSQDSIGRCFGPIKIKKRGASPQEKPLALRKACEMIANKELASEDFPPITVVKKDGEFYR